MEYVWLITQTLAHHLLRKLRHQSLVKGAAAVAVDTISVALRRQMVQDVAMKKVKQKKQDKRTRESEEQRGRTEYSQARRERKKDMMEEKRVRREDGDVKRHKKEK